MLWKKTATNYSKWDYFTSSSDEEPQNSEPVVPKDNPDLAAMVKDMDERAKRRKEDKKKAEALKL